MDYYFENTTSKIRSTAFKKLNKLIKEIYLSNPASVIYGFLTHSQLGKKIAKSINFGNTDKFKQIPDSMKRYLHKIRSRKKEFFEKSDVFIEILKNATFTRKEIIKHLNISISTKKWRRILHDIQKRKE